VRTRRLIATVTLVVAVALFGNATAAYATLTPVNGLNGTLAAVVAATGTGTTVGTAYGLGAYTSGGPNFIDRATAFKMFPSAGAEVYRELALNKNGWFLITNGLKGTGFYFIGAPSNGAVAVASGVTANVLTAPGYAEVASTIGSGSLLGGSQQLLVDSADDAGRLGFVGELVSGFLPRVLTSAAWIPVGLLGGDSVQPTAEQMVLNQCTTDIVGSNGYPDWSSNDFAASYVGYGSSWGGTVLSIVSLGAAGLDPIKAVAAKWSDGSGLVCDPAMVFPNLFAASTVAAAPWEIRFCIGAQVWDGNGYFWPATTAAAAGTSWSWASQAELDWLNAACPPAEMTQVFGTSYTTGIAGGHGSPSAGYGTSYTPTGYAVSGDCETDGYYEGAGFSGWDVSWYCHFPQAPTTMNVPMGLYSNGNNTAVGYASGTNCTGAKTPGQSIATNGQGWTGFCSLGSGNYYGYSGQIDHAAPGTGSFWLYEVDWYNGTTWYSANIYTRTATGVIPSQSITGATQNSGLPSPGGSTPVGSPATTLAPLGNPAPAITAPSSLPSGSSSTPVWGPVEWLGNKLIGGISWLGQSITNGLSQGFSDTIGVLGQIESGVVSLPGLIVSGLGGELENLFIPSSTTVASAETNVGTEPPFNWVSSFTGGITALYNGFTGGLSGSSCAPYIGYSGAVVPSYGGYLMTANSACPGNGAGHTRTAADRTAGNLDGFRTPIRAFLVVLLVAGFMVRLMRTVGPWSARQDDMGPDL
jgi:hypothetical protein